LTASGSLPEQLAEVIQEGRSPRDGLRVSEVNLDRGPGLGSGLRHLRDGAPLLCDARSPFRVGLIFSGLTRRGSLGRVSELASGAHADEAEGRGFAAAT
jgi:hypothetical protein